MMKPRKLLALILVFLMMAACMAPVSAAEASNDGAEGDVLQLDMEVGLDITGTVCYYEQVWVIPQGTITLQKGDLLCYDVRLLDEHGGFGGLDIVAGYGGENELGDANLRDDAMNVDQNFLRCHPTVNLAGLCLNQWFAREVELSVSFIEVANQHDLRIMIAVDIPNQENVSKMAGQTVNVQYDNIRIVRDGEIIYTIFADREHAVPEEPTYYLGLDGANEHVSTDVYINTNAEVNDPEPTDPPATNPPATDPPATDPKPTEPADPEPAGNNLGLIIGIAAAVVVVVAVVVIVVVRKKKGAQEA